MPAECGDDRQFGVGQGVEAVHPDGSDSASPFALNARRRVFESPRAQHQATFEQQALEFAVDRQEGLRQRRIRQMPRQASAVAVGRGEFVDRPGERRVEAGGVRHAREFGPCRAPGCLFHHQLDYGIGRLRELASPWLDESMKGLDQSAREDESLAGDLVLQVLR